MEGFNKQYFMKKCYFCNLLDLKSIDIKTKEVYIKCCSKDIWIKLTDLQKTPNECPYYFERFMLNNNDSVPNTGR